MKSHPNGTIAGQIPQHSRHKQQLPRTERGAESNGLTGTRPRGTTKCATHGKHTDKASTKTRLTRGANYSRKVRAPDYRRTSLAPQRCPRPKAPSSPVKERAHPAPPPASPTSAAARTAPVGHNASRHACTRASVCLCNDRKLERANDQRTASAEQPRPSMAKVGPKPGRA